MNLFSSSKGVCCAGLLGLALATQAQTFSYNTGDVLLCFRNSGSGLDLVVNAGAHATFTNLAPNQRITLSTYTGSQLNAVGVNGSGWSAFTYLSDYTMFITRPRVSLETKTSSWANKSGSVLQLTALRMDTVVTGANANRLFNVLNTGSVVIEQDNSTSNPNYPVGRSYRDALLGSGSLANFAGTFQGAVENTVPGDFTDAGAVRRSDFYRVDPTGSGSATWLGYFELNTNGVMSYVAYPSTTPVVQSFSRAGNVTTINYTAGLYGTYKLRATNSAGLSAARTNWPVVATLTSGDTALHGVTDTTTDTERFYIITAQ